MSDPDQEPDSDPEPDPDPQLCYAILLESEYLTSKQEDTARIHLVNKQNQIVLGERERREKKEIECRDFSWAWGIQIKRYFISLP